MIKEGEKVKVDPRLTGLDEWIEGTVIDIEHNPVSYTHLTLPTKA